MKTRWESCVFILLMLLPGAWLLNASVQGGVSTVFAQNRTDSGVAEKKDNQNAPPTSALRIAGEWQGMISRLHVTVKIDQASDGNLSGKLTSPDQGNITLPIDTVSVGPDGTIDLELKTIGASYEGKLNADRSEINGTWKQSGNSLPLSLHRPGAAAEAFSLKPRTIGRIPFAPCRTQDGNTEGLCGKYEVYENRQSQSGRKIALNIMVLPALSEKPASDPFFPLAGGPGQSAVEAYPLTGFTAKIRQQRDVVLVDQRGTGGSNPLPCNLRDPKDSQAIIGDSVPLDKVRACRSELEKKADLSQYTTSIWADDLDEVRQALGYDKINVFGGSYGTRAALVYLRQHGNHVRSLALEGVAPPEYRIPIAFSHSIEDSVNQLLDRCAADDSCHKSYPDLRKEFQTILERLDKSPAQFEVQNPNGSGMQAITLSRGSFVANLRPMLYVPSFISQFPYTIHRAYLNDWSIYGIVALSIRDAIDKQVNRGLSFSVICSEDVPGVSEGEIRRETSDTYLGDFQVRMYQKACAEWPHAKLSRDFHAPIRSSVPALLISGALDPATPPQASASAARELSADRVVIVKDGTHGTGSPCIDGIISDFVAHGSTKALDTTCVNDIHLAPFLTQGDVDKLRQKASGQKDESAKHH